MPQLLVGEIVDTRCRVLQFVGSPHPDVVVNFALGYEPLEDASSSIG